MPAAKDVVADKETDAKGIASTKVKVMNAGEIPVTATTLEEEIKGNIHTTILERLSPLKLPRDKIQRNLKKD
jgi:hypothetical protein